MLLAIDTSTSAVSAALHDGENVVARASTIDARRHTEILAPQIDAILRDSGVTPAQLTRVIVGVGPGPFTGLRVGIVTGLTFGAALDIPVDGICSLDALAYRAAQEGMNGPILVATDARRKEVYWAEYDLGDGPLPVGDPAVEKPAVVAETVGDLRTIGRGAQLYADLLNDATGGRAELLDVDAADLATLALQRLETGQPLLPAEPLYLRRPDAQPLVPSVPAPGR